MKAVRLLIKKILCVLLPMLLTACSNILSEIEFSSLDASLVMSFSAPEKRIYSGSETASFGINFFAEDESTDIDFKKTDIRMMGKTQGCSLELIKVSRVSFRADVTGCTYLSGDLWLETSKKRKIFLKSPEVIFDNSVPYEFVVTTTTPDEKVLLPIFENKGRHVRIDWGDESDLMFIDEKDGVKDLKALEHVYKTPGDYHIKISGNFIGYGDKEGDQEVIVHTFGSEAQVDFTFKPEDYPVVITVFRGFNMNYYYFPEYKGGNETVVLPAGASAYEMYLNVKGSLNVSSASILVSGPKGTNDAPYAMNVDREVMLPLNYKLKSVVSLGSVGWKDWSNLFAFSPILSVPSGDSSLVKDMSSMFSRASNANPDVSNWDTSNVTDMSYMFFKATSAAPNTIGWDTSNVTNMSGMFKEASLANPDVSSWNTSSVIDMSHMFEHASSANPDVSNWDTSSVINMSGIFRVAVLATPNVTEWDVSNVTDMYGLFDNATLANPDLSKWDFSGLYSHVSYSIEWIVSNSGVSPQNYSTFLQRLDLTAPVGLKAEIRGVDYYSWASPARSSLLAKGFTFVDGNEVP